MIIVVWHAFPFVAVPLVTQYVQRRETHTHLLVI
jgi:hypothetical protein